MIFSFPECQDRKDTNAYKSYCVDKIFIHCRVNMYCSYFLKILILGNLSVIISKHSSMVYMKK